MENSTKRKYIKQIDQMTELKEGNFCANCSKPAAEKRAQSNVPSILTSIYKLEYIYKLSLAAKIPELNDENDQDQFRLCRNCLNVLDNLSIFYDEFNRLRAIESGLSRKLKKFDLIVTQIQSHQCQVHVKEEISDHWEAPDVDNNERDEESVDDNQDNQDSVADVVTFNEQEEIVSPPPSENNNGPWVKLRRLTEEELPPRRARKINYVDIDQDDEDDQQIVIPEDNDSDYDPGLDDYIEPEHEEPPDPVEATTSQPSSTRPASTRPASTRRKRSATSSIPVFSCCPLCGEKALSREELNNHFQRTHVSSESQNCPFCAKKIENEQSLRNHIKGHAGIRVHPCPQEGCDKVYQHGSHLNVHIKLNHDKPRPELKCPQCGQYFNTKPILTEHVRAHRLHKCHCGKSFRIPYDLKKHMKTHEKVKDPTVKHKCSNCRRKVFNLEEHKKDCTTLVKPHLCPTCSAGFVSLSSLKEHIHIHTKEKRHLCAYCGEAFRQLSVLNRHVLRHTGERPHKCHLCEKSFIQSGALTRHLVYHSGEKSFLCTECGMALTTREGLRRHMQCHTGELPHKCLVCGACFPDRRPLKKHLLTHAQDEDDEEDEEEEDEEEEDENCS